MDNKPPRLTHLRQKSLFQKSYLVRRPKREDSSTRFPQPSTLRRAKTSIAQDDSSDDDEAEDNGDDDSNTDSVGPKPSTSLDYSSGSTPIYDSPESQPFSYTNLTSPSQMRIRFTLERRNSETNANILDAGDLLHSSFQDEPPPPLRKRKSLLSKRFSPPMLSPAGRQKAIAFQDSSTPAKQSADTITSSNTQNATTEIASGPNLQPPSQIITANSNTEQDHHLLPSVSTLIEPTSADYRHEECGDSSSIQVGTGQIYSFTDNRSSPKGQKVPEFAIHLKDDTEESYETALGEFQIERRQLLDRIGELEQNSVSNERVLRAMSERLVEREMELRDVMLKTGYTPKCNTDGPV
jgi:hypothetical protein